jgi:glutamine synthetase
MMTLSELRKAVQRGEIDTVLTVFPDMTGRLMGKRMSARFFLDDASKHGWHACAYLFTVDMEMEPLPGFATASWSSGYQDMKAVPDMATLRRIPWLEKTALVICDLEMEDGRPVEVSPRQILKRQLARAKALGFRPKTASELEFYLYKDNYEAAAAKHYQDLEPASRYLEDYHILQTSKEEPVIQAIRTGMEAAGIPVEGSKGEWGRGQEEINLRYADALEMADRHVIYKNGAKEIAWQKGYSITFMAKPHAERAGSSMHVHSSLWDLAGKRNLFGEPRGETLFSRYLAGQAALGRPLSYFYAPTVNSYKRYQSGSFAPTRLVCGVDNRTCGLRVIGERGGRRVENRLPGADANPYLAFAATIAAGLHGIARKLKAPRMFTGNAYETPGLPEVPKTLRDALDLFEREAALRELFGKDVVEHYVHAGRLEQAAYDQAVTDWERRRYFERI